MPKTHTTKGSLRDEDAEYASEPSSGGEESAGAMPEPPAAVVLRAMEMLIPRLRGPGAWVSTEEMGLVIALAEAALALHKRVYGWDACDCSHREISATRGASAWEEEVEHDAGCDWYTSPNREAREALTALAEALREGR